MIQPIQLHQNALGEIQLPYVTNTLKQKSGENTK